MPLAAWIAGCAARSALAAVVAYLLVLPVAGDGYTVGEYFVALLFGAFAWPFYLLAVHRVSTRPPRAFRIRAVLLALILAVPLNIGSLALGEPEIAAADLCYLLIGLSIRPAPRAGDLGPARA
jgi:hypothetical protein